MLTLNQTQDLAEFYQINEFTIFREYLQLLFLGYLYRHPKSNKIHFKGGTAIRLLLNSPRFSEDLDFSSQYNQRQLKKIIAEVEKKLQKELPEAKISLQYQGRKSIRFRFKYHSPDFKYPFAIRLDLTEKEKVQKAAASPLVTKYPLIFPVITHLAPEEILAEKIRALLTRGKGRDVFDLWFLLAQGAKINPSLVKIKLKEVDKKFNQENLIKKIEAFPIRKLELDLGQFLPQPQRKIISNLKSLTSALLRHPPKTI